MAVEIKFVPFASDNENSIRLIRNTVFTNEQNIDSTADFDGEDYDAFHCLTYVNDKAVGTGRMLADGHIGRIAVLSEFRGLGLGSKIIQSLINLAVDNHYSRVYLGSQKQAINFYTKLGFVPFGNEYTEVDIQHILMEKFLS